MSKSAQQKSLRGSILNTKKVQVVVTKANGSQFALESHKQLKGVSLSDFRELPPGVEFLAE
jgi:hypothetical protein